MLQTNNNKNHEENKKQIYKFRQWILRKWGTFNLASQRQQQYPTPMQHICHPNEFRQIRFVSIVTVYEKYQCETLRYRTNFTHLRYNYLLHSLCRKFTICRVSSKWTFIFRVSRAIFFNHTYFFSLIHRDTRPSPLIRCRLINENNEILALPSIAPDHRSEARLRIDPKVLVFVETSYSRLGRDIAELLVYNRIK